MNKKILMFGMIMMFTIMLVALVAAGSGDYIKEEPEIQEPNVQSTSSSGNYYNKKKVQTYEDDINDLRKELLLKQLLEKQESEQITEEVITYEKSEIEEVIVNETEEPKSRKGLTIGIVAVIILLLLFSVWLYNQKTEEEIESEQE